MTAITEVIESTDLFTCKECEDSCPLGEMQDGMCMDCADTDTDCDECGEMVRKDKTVEIEGSHYCRSCVTVCPSCGDNESKGNMEEVRNSGSRSTTTICEACREDSFCCEDCGDLCIGESHDINYNTVCQRCMDNNYFYCDNCDQHHHTDDDNDCGDCDADTREHSRNAIVGVASSRFSLRTVGIEIETGRGATSRSFSESFARLRHWGYKEDGSLNSGAMELVSPPLGGDKITTELAQVYDMLRREGVDMTDSAAGCHVHVDYRDIRSKIIAADISGDETPSDQFLEWGNNMTDMVRLLVSRGRAKNTYCSAEFGTRNYNEVEPQVRKKLPDSGYSAVAVREATVEFRIWSVTGDSAVTQARAEFCQKSVDYLSKILSHRSTTKIHKESSKRWKKAVQSFLMGNTTRMERLLKLSENAMKFITPILTKRVAKELEDGPTFRKREAFVPGGGRNYAGSGCDCSACRY